MIKEIQAPKRINRKDFSKTKIFLAGSIDNGKAEKWQSDVILLMNTMVPLDEHDNLIILNPRRDDWDPSWKNDKNNDEFADQVMWELDNLERADCILMYFSPGTTSPISLLELGKYGVDERMVVVCPEGYSYKGNVDIFCEENDIVQKDSLKEAILYIMYQLDIEVCDLNLEDDN